MTGEHTDSPPHSAWPASGGSQPNEIPSGHATEAPDINAVRVAAYVRISTDEDHQPFSLPAQTARLQAYIDSQPNWTLIEPMYRDEKSGATLHRQGLQQALAAARTGTFDILLVYRVDRLARSLRGLVTILDDLAAAGVGFRSATEPVDTSNPVGRMLIQMLGVFAQFERDLNIDRVINGMERKAATGQWTTGTYPYGYRIDPHTHHLIPDEAEAPILAQMFALYADTFTGTRAIAARLNARGLRHRSGRPWSGHTIGKILANRTYLGETRFRNITTPNAHPPLIDQETFHRVQRIRTSRAHHDATPTAHTSDYLLAGLVTCMTCGSHYVGTAAHGRRHRYRYYTCQRHARYGRQACNSPRLPADQLEQQILKTIAAAYRDTDLPADALAAVANTHRDNTSALRAEHAAVTAQMTLVQQKIGRYLNAFETDAIPAHLCRERLQAFTLQAAQLIARRDQLHHELEHTKPPPPADRGQARQHLHHMLATADPHQIKTLTNLLITGIDVYDRHHIQPYLRHPAHKKTERRNTEPATQPGRRRRTNTDRVDSGLLGVNGEVRGNGPAASLARPTVRPACGLDQRVKPLGTFLAG
ncbi:recombinase family protein [Phytohabitans aurantiacus]|uniref:Recombinase family protein n=1 Tax=Phytohabitans aurantiacus TaxID=3016789 RepID=A0ABQ5RDA6_9ACTN|nr:recombinase family protein [Phytohabitans aurantiacus]GLI03935.1 hypothetical protein Pa4123_92160 [Phytohabitans aurantiacus]